MIWQPRGVHRPAALARLLRLGRRAVPLADRPLAPLAHLPAYIPALIELPLIDLLLLL